MPFVRGFLRRYHPGILATMGLVVLTPGTGELFVVSCGHMPLLLVDDRFYHLDKALCPLSSGHVMAYMDAFSPHAQALLRRAIDPEFLTSGVMFDGSSIAGWKAINESDMLLKPDCATAVLDPFAAQPQLIIFCDVHEPLTGQLFARKGAALLLLGFHSFGVGLVLGMPLGDG